MWTLKGLSYSTLTRSLTRSLTRWEMGWGVGSGWVSADSARMLTLEPTGTLFFWFFFYLLTTQCAVNLGSTSESPWCFIIYFKYKVLHICILWVIYKREAKQFNWQKYMISGIIYKYRKLYFVFNNLWLWKNLLLYKYACMLYFCVRICTRTCPVTNSYTCCLFNTHLNLSVCPRLSFYNIWNFCKTLSLMAMK